MAKPESSTPGPMRNPVPQTSNRYGAPMGRRYTERFTLEALGTPLYLRRIRLNSGGYDAGGAYWGLGPPLFYVEDGVGNSRFFRARDRAEAKAKILEDWPDATFYR